MSIRSSLVFVSLLLFPSIGLTSNVCDLSNVVHESRTSCDAYFAFKDKVDANTSIMVPMRDGVRLITDVYLPKERNGKGPAIFVKTPYDENQLSGWTLKFANLAIDNGYAFVVQNERGRYYSEGTWEILGKPRTDGYDALSWIAKQEWSDEQVGTFGCSSSAEWQMALAAQNHPAHTAMVPAAAGAGIGRVGRFYEQGNWYKGGVFQTLFGIWLYSVQQNQYPRFSEGLTQQEINRLRIAYDLTAKTPKIDWKKQTKKLPLISWFDDIAGNKGPFKEFLMREPNHPDWYKGGLYHDNEGFSVPALWLNSWYDVSMGPNMELYNHVRENGSNKQTRDNQYVIVAPTLHCGFWRIPENQDLIVGERNLGRVELDANKAMIDFFDYFMKPEKSSFKEDNARVKYFTLGDNQWQTSDVWPPQNVELTSFYLTSNGRANSLFGNGRLTREPTTKSQLDQFIYDPMNPVPALGGNVCCNGGASPGGSYDQRAIEARNDVLVYTSDILTEDTEVTGEVLVTVYVSSSAKDTDFTVKLVDVYPDGTAYNVVDTIHRMRYRNGYEKAEYMQEGEIYELAFSPMLTSNVFKKGHRIRIEISSSKFPQFMRNLNTGENNATETEVIVAKNRVHYSQDYPSRVVLPIVK